MADVKVEYDKATTPVGRASPVAQAVDETMQRAKVAARFRNGMLEVVAPKARPPAAARQVPVATRA